MDAKTFGAFLARMRKEQSMTQAELAEQLHVTDKAVSRWERGVGLPDVNLLEPLAQALGLSLADLMHCRDPKEEEPEQTTLEDFLTMLRRQKTLDWRSVRLAMFWLSVLFGACGLLLCPEKIVVQWRIHNAGMFPSNEMLSIVTFPLLIVGEFFALELWNMYEQFGLFRKWGEKNAVITRSLMYGSPFVRWVKIGFDFFFFFTCGFLIPAMEFVFILANRRF